MKAVVINQYGGRDKLMMARYPKPMPKADEVLIEMYATSINPIDWKVREGHLQERLKFAFPIILGWDAAGVISDVGSGVHDFEVGDRVFTRPPTTNRGTYAEYITAPADLVTKLPDKISFNEGASIPLVAQTAWQCLFDFADMKAGERVLIHGGAGGVGSMAIQIAKSYGAEVIATGSSESQDIIEQLGADQFINYRTQTFENDVDSVDIVLDTIGGETQSRSFDVLTSGGRLVSIAQPPDEKKAKSKGIKAGFVWLEPDGERLKRLAFMLEDDQLKPLIAKTFPFSEEGMQEAHHMSEEGHAKGKIIIEIRSET
ncbi:NADP-dependent oxidoreductase [Tuberibacillus sp. Marseille-P3662]|uniref:NADP-dependent oxidoreductase n=1 Tax=Tuberibacillus sp. Marseille-P3662 TaxID=1965358 RepID=UPI000A1CD0D8|nr:NADP-dependent oxidoreductase [Tuberibacillus sp. Marseille-P3662]